VQDDQERMPGAAEIAAINARHLSNTPLRPADLLFVFGTRVDEALRAETACRLWREGLFHTAIVSGGVTAGSSLAECAVIKPLMVQGGVPADRILEERGVVVIPDVLANAGGVTCSYLEQVQGSANAYWRRDQVFQELDERLQTASRAVHDVADHGAMSLRDAAYLIAVDRVAKACRARGWV